MWQTRPRCGWHVPEQHRVLDRGDGLLHASRACPPPFVTDVAGRHPQETRSGMQGLESCVVNNRLSIFSFFNVAKQCRNVTQLAICDDVEVGGE